jgi:hypothetical protein
MSATICLVLDAHVVHVVTGDARVLTSVPWDPDQADAMIESVRDVVGSVSGVVLAVGLGLVEIAEPSVPPLADDARRRVLWRDADRYFPLAEPAAIVCVDAMAFAAPARHVRAWVRAAESLGAVRAIVTVPQLCAALDRNALYAVRADDGERGEVRVRDGALASVRRIPDAPDGADARDAVTLTTFGEGAIGLEALRWLDAPVEAQLLDAELVDRVRGARRWRWGRSAVAAVAAITLLLWSADRWRGSQLAALESQAASLDAQAGAARLAEQRLSAGRTELAMLSASDSTRQSAQAPLAVLAQLTRVLPRDVFLQRLEWDGTEWRAEGTADNAPRLVPLLDGDAHFANVRIAAPSQRFQDAGRARETFAIGFRVRDARRVASAPAAPALRSADSSTVRVGSGDRAPR